jgi:adenylosuccinate synthase
LIERYKQWYGSVTVMGFIDLQVLVANSHMPVFEAAHGVLLDKLHGFHPHTTWSDTTDKPAWDMLIDVHETCEVYQLGITRTYMTRHGAGPLATEITAAYIDPAEGPLLIADDDNAAGRYQGGLRVGFHDLVALRYATRCLKHPLNGLAVTHCDKLHLKATGFICTKYIGVDLDSYVCEKEASLQALNFTAAYQNVKLSLEPVKRDEVAEFLAKGLGVPLVIKSFGKRTDQKLFMGLPAEDEFVAKKPVQVVTPEPAPTTAEAPAPEKTPEPVAPASTTTN